MVLFSLLTCNNRDVPSLKVHSGGISDISSSMKSVFSNEMSRLTTKPAK